MQSLSFQLLILASFVAAPATLHAASQTFQVGKEIAQQVSALNAAEQLVFMRPLLTDRFEKAAQLALPENERQTRSARYAAILKRIESGSTLSLQGVERILNEIAALEQLAVDQLSLQYRVRVYQQFRTDRSEYDRRMAAWRTMISQWEASQSAGLQGTKALAWMATALDRMRYDQNAVLPKLPTFEQIAVPKIVEREPVLQPEKLTITTPPSRTAITEMNAGSAASLPERTAPTATDVSELPPRIAHRVEKPVLPDVTQPPRVIIRDVRPVIAPPDVPPPDVPPISETVEQPVVDAEPTRTIDPVPQPMPEPQVAVDLYELTIRVKAYNLSLKDLTNSIHDEAIWSVAKLTTTLDELDQLSQRREQLSLYRDVISSEERVQTGELEPLDAAIALLGAKIFSAREHSSEAGAEASAQELVQLNELSQKLAQLAAKRAK